MQGVGFRVRMLGVGFKVIQGSGFRVQGVGFRVQGAGCRVQGAGCRMQGAGSMRNYKLSGAALSFCRTLLSQPR